MHCKSYSHFFSKKFQHICVSLGVNFNESLTNAIVSFEQLGPDHQQASAFAVDSAYLCNVKKRGLIAFVDSEGSDQGAPHLFGQNSDWIQ